MAKILKNGQNFAKNGFFKFTIIVLFTPTLSLYRSHSLAVIALQHLWCCLRPMAHQCPCQCPPPATPATTRSGADASAASWTATKTEAWECAPRASYRHACLRSAGFPLYTLIVTKNAVRSIKLTQEATATSPVAKAGLQELVGSHASATQTLVSSPVTTPQFLFHA